MAVATTMDELPLRLPLGRSLRMNVLKNPPDYVAEFLDTKGVCLKPSLSTAVCDSLDNSKCDPLKPQKLDLGTEPLQELRRQTVDFKTWLKQFAPRKPSKTKNVPDFMQTHSFEQVVELLNTTALKYRNKNGVQAVLQKLCQSFAQNGKGLRDWMSLLPDGEYSSVVCGSLKLIISSAVKAKEVRDKVLEAVACIPEAMSKATAQLQLYDSTKLASTFRDFFGAVLETCRCLLKWLSKSSAKHAAAAFFQQGSYGKEIRDNLDVLEKLAAEIASHSSICLQQRVKYVEQVAEENLENSNVTKDTADTLLAMCYSFLQHYYKDRKTNNDFQEEMRRMLTKRSTRQKRARKNIGPSPEQLHEFLTGSGVSRAKDFQRILGHGKTLDMRGQERLERLIKGPELRRWMVSDDSELLFFDGNAPGIEKASALSYAHALLVGALESFGQAAICLSFFCSLYTDTQNPNTGARELVRELVYQLLSQHTSFNTSFLSDKNLQQLLGQSRQDLSTLLSIFRKLIQQLPEHVVTFCLINGTRYYEMQDRQDDLVRVLEVLRDLTESDRVSSTFKVLITNNSRPSLKTRQCFDARQVVKLPLHIEAQNQGFNPRSWSKSALQQLGIAQGTEGSNKKSTRNPLSSTERRQSKEEDDDADSGEGERDPEDNSSETESGDSAESEVEEEDDTSSDRANQ